MHRPSLPRLFRPLSLGLVILAAGCQSPPPPAPSPGPGEWRRIAWDPAATTSRCIGRPETPLCAVETLLACFQWGKIELCRQVDARTEEYAQAFATPAQPGTLLSYRITGQQTVSEPAADGFVQPGDVAITVEQRETAAPTPAETPPEALAGAVTATDFLLRRTGDGAWRIVGWGDPAAD